MSIFIKINTVLCTKNIQIDFNGGETLLNKQQYAL